NRQSRTSHALAILVSAGILFQPSVAPLLGAQGAPAKAPAAPAKAPAAPAKAPAAPAARDIDGGWPRDYSAPSGGTVRVFQPQVSNWNGQRHMVAYAAVSYTAKGAEKPALGTVTIEGDTSVAVTERLVNFTNVKLTETH